MEIPPMNAPWDEIPLPARRHLLSSEGTSDYWEMGNGSTLIPTGTCFCQPWLDSRGTPAEKTASQALQWVSFGITVVILCFYAYNYWKATTGWEETYVGIIEIAKCLIEFWFEFDTPAMLYLSTGDRVLFIRYAYWLLTCPVILIHLCNLTGLKEDYSKRCMTILVSDIGTIVFGTVSAMSSIPWLKVVFFCIGVCYAGWTFFNAAKVYIESYYVAPKGQPRTIIRIMAWIYFVSWAMYPVMFVLGQEGFGHISIYASTIYHTCSDLIAKNLWGLLGHLLRIKVAEHILIHGDIRKTTKINVASQEMEVATMVDEEGDDTFRVPGATYAKRGSFHVMRDRLVQKGVDVRLDLTEMPEDDGHQPGMIYGHHYGMHGAGGGGGGGGGQKSGPSAMEMGMIGKSAASMAGSKGGMGGIGAGAGIEDGRVILAVPDLWMVDFFREQFAALPAHIELIPALGADNVLQLVQHAAAMGGCDFVLVHPEFLRAKGPGGLVGRLKAMGQRVAAFVMGAQQEMLQGSGVDGFVEVPAFGGAFNQAALVALIANMQRAKKQAPVMGMGMGGSMGGMGDGGMGDGYGRTPTHASGGGGSMMHGGMGMPGSMGNNPLYGTAPSPLGSQPGAMSGGPASMMHGAAVPSGGGAQGGGTEAEMLQQLMGEINRLKAELGE